MDKIVNNISLITPYKLAIFGQPISHTRSPQIYTLFAQQCGIEGIYMPHLSQSINIYTDLDHFFAAGGYGANITAPFKKDAYQFANQHSEGAALAGAVNTLKRIDNIIFGDNTDGIGLLADLQRLKFITPASHVLLLGAGGAAHAIVPTLLAYGCSVVIYNRSLTRAINFIHRFSRLGSLSLFSLPSSTVIVNNKFDLVINTTGATICSHLLSGLNAAISSKTAWYDLCYQKHPSQLKTPFLIQVTDAFQVNAHADGLGMLVMQAAYSFELWHGVMPDPIKTLFALK